MSPAGLNHLTQELIAGGMPERVVGRLEAVNVDEGEDQRPVRSLRPDRLALQLEGTRVPSIRAGELIDGRGLSLLCR